MKTQKDITLTVCKSLGLGITKDTLNDLTWEVVSFKDRVGLVPNIPLRQNMDHTWFMERLMSLGEGGLIKIQGKMYQVKLPRRGDVKALKEVVNRNTVFWVRGGTPRVGKIGPRGGTYQRLHKAGDTDVHFLPVLYLCEGQEVVLKSIVRRWLANLMSVVKRIKVRTGDFFKQVWKKYRRYHKKTMRVGHWRVLKNGTAAWVKPCLVSGHYWGESDAINA